MGHERGCSALASGRPTCGSHRHYQPTDRTIMPLMEGNSGCVSRRHSMLEICRHATSRCEDVHTRVHTQRHTGKWIIIIHPHFGLFWVYIHEPTFSEIYRDHAAELISTENLTFWEINIFILVDLFLEIVASGSSPALLSSPAVLYLRFSVNSLSLFPIIIFQTGKAKGHGHLHAAGKAEREGSQRWTGRTWRIRRWQECILHYKR